MARIIWMLFRGQGIFTQSVKRQKHQVAHIYTVKMFNVCAHSQWPPRILDSPQYLLLDALLLCVFSNFVSCRKVFFISHKEQCRECPNVLEVCNCLWTIWAELHISPLHKAKYHLKLNAFFLMICYDFPHSGKAFDSFDSFSFALCALAVCLFKLLLSIVKGHNVQVQRNRDFSFSVLSNVILVLILSWHSCMWSALYHVLLFFFSDEVILLYQTFCTFNAKEVRLTQIFWVNWSN